MPHDVFQNGSAQTPPDGRFDDAAVKVYHAAHDRLYSVIALLDAVVGFADLSIHTTSPNPLSRPGGHYLFGCSRPGRFQCPSGLPGAAFQYHT